MAVIISILQINEQYKYIAKFLFNGIHSDWYYRGVLKDFLIFNRITLVYFIMTREKIICIDFFNIMMFNFMGIIKIKDFFLTEKENEGRFVPN